MTIEYDGLEACDPSTWVRTSTSTGPAAPGGVYRTFVFGVNTNENPVWWLGESVHSVWAISPR